jgi:putative acetyltransferase
MISALQRSLDKSLNFTEHMNIRPETHDDIDAIRHVTYEAFDHRAAEAKLVDLLRGRGELTLSLVAEDNGTIIGHLAYSPMTIEGAPANFKALGLGPISVLPSHQRKGIGSALIHESLKQCAALGCDAVLLLGHTGYYPRFGFQPARTFGLTSDYGDGDHFMALPLHAGALDNVHGKAQYVRAFADCDC